MFAVHHLRIMFVPTVAANQSSAPASHGVAARVRRGWRYDYRVAAHLTERSSTRFAHHKSHAPRGLKRHPARAQRLTHGTVELSRLGARRRGSGTHQDPPFRSREVESCVSSDCRGGYNGHCISVCWPSLVESRSSGKENFVRIPTALADRAGRIGQSPCPMCKFHVRRGFWRPSSWGGGDRNSMQLSGNDFQPSPLPRSAIGATSSHGF